MSETHVGGCLCGAVRFEVTGAMREVVFCHCSQCRKQTGLYYASTSCEESQMTLSGGENVRWYHASPEAARGFCSTCGSALFWKHDKAATISIQAGSLDSPSGLAKGYHIFCADKGDFYEINDGLPQYAQGSPKVVTN